ncbi:MAG TPA: ATP-binding protein, partial [Acidimicrobiales bacterium]|nr:ATP-binding protein [Acidimicrobiales bacterium]
EARAAAEAARVSDSWVNDLADAKLVVASVEGLGLAGPAANGDPAALASLRTRLVGISQEFFRDVQVAWLGPEGVPLATSTGMPAVIGDAGLLASNPVVRAALSQRSFEGAASLVAGHPVALAVYPYVTGTGAAEQLVGAAAVLSPLDATYLANEARDDSSLSLLLTDGHRVLARYPAGSALAAPGVAGAALRGAAGPAAEAGDRFVAARAIGGIGGRPVMAVVAQSPTATFVRARQEAFHTLFLVALGGALLVFLLSVWASDRISRGLEVLTAAARRISGGDTSARTGIRSDDEVGVLGSAFDTMAGAIDSQTEALRRAAAEEARLRGRIESVLSGMGEALVAVDADGLVTELNPAAESLTGVTAADLVGRPVDGKLDLRMPDGRHLGELMAEPPPGGLSAEAELHGCSGDDGEVVPVAVNVTSLLDIDGRPTGAVAVLRDLRPERELERMKNEFLSRVGHELRTPLTAILGYSRLLTGRQVPPEQASGWHGEILGQAERLERTVAMLEFFAAGGGNRLTLEVAPVAPQDLLRRAADRWGGRLDGRHPIGRKVARGLPEVMVDSRWTQLALDELIDNAVKFAPAGGRVTLEAGPGPDPATVRLSVVDQGEGMSPDAVAVAFSEFIQGDSSDTRRFGGLGLGLPFVKRVADAQGAVVDVASTPGKGSTFSLLVPAVRPVGERRRPVRRRSGIPEGRPTPP